MRILFPTPSLGIGGAERLVLGYATAMRDRGHSAAIAHGTQRGVENVLATVARDEGIDVFHVGDLPLEARTLPRWSRGLRRALAGFDPDVLHAQSVTTSLAARLADRRRPLAMTLHGLVLPGNERAAAPLLAALGARLTAVSEPTAWAVGRHWPHPRIDVLPAGIDIDLLERNAATEDVDRRGSPAFCCVARQEPIKGVDVLVEAFAKVAEALPDAGLTLVGTGSQLEPNRRRAAELGLGERIRFAGAVPRAEPWLRAADVAVLPSRREGLPVAALEALGLARPIVASDVGGTGRVVRDGETGWLVAPEDPAALGEALIAAGSDADETRRRGQAGRDLIARDYAASALYDTLEAVLSETAGRTRTG